MSAKVSENRTAILLTIALILILACLLSVHIARQAVGREEALAYNPSALPTPQVQRPFAVFIGDSYTAGTGATSPSAHFATIVAHRRNWAFRNLGQGGTGYATTAGIGDTVCTSTECEPYTSQLAAIRRLQPQVVVVSGGRNDLIDADSDLRQSISQFYQDLRAAAPDAQLLATSPLWDASRPPTMLNRLGNYVREAVESVDGAYLELGQPLRGRPEDVALDGVHPNDAGHGAIAASVERALLRLENAGSAEAS